MSEAIPVTVSTAGNALAGLPLTARLTLLFAARLRRGTLEVSLPNGRRLRFGGAEPGPAAVMIINDLGFGRRFISGGDIGIAEAYLRGEWQTPDLTQFLLLFCLNHDLSETMLEHRPFVRLWQRLRHLLNRNTRHRAKRNIFAHYDLGNRFYESWLDETMTYSSALFSQGADDLAAAQRCKYEACSRSDADGAALPNMPRKTTTCAWSG